MSKQIYEHLPKWRRIFYDLAVEAGLKKFVNPTDVHDEKSSGNLDSSAPENRSENLADPVQARKPIRR